MWRSNADQRFRYYQLPPECVTLYGIGSSKGGDCTILYIRLRCHDPDSFIALYYMLAVNLLQRPRLLWKTTRDPLRFAHGRFKTSQSDPIINHAVRGWILAAGFLRPCQHACAFTATLHLLRLATRILFSLVPRPLRRPIYWSTSVFFDVAVFPLAVFSLFDSVCDADATDTRLRSHPSTSLWC